MTVQSIDEDAKWQITLELCRATGQHQSLALRPIDRPKQRRLTDTRLSDDLNDACRPVALDGTQRTLDRPTLTDAAHKLHRCW